MYSPRSVYNANPRILMSCMQRLPFETTTSVSRNVHSRTW